MATRAHSNDGRGLILIGLGANLPSPCGPPLATCEAALESLGEAGVTVTRRSRWFRSPPMPPSSQPWFVNGVAVVDTDLESAGLLAVMLDVERRFGRVRGARWEARTLDLDLLDYRGLVRRGAPPPELPHPRLHERAFVLLPLAEVAPGWRQPVFGRRVEALIAALPAGAAIEPLP